MQVYEEAIFNYEPAGVILGDTLSEESREKALVVGSIIDKYVERKKVGKKDSDYGELFDKFYDKAITELNIYKHLIDIEF